MRVSWLLSLLLGLWGLWGAILLGCSLSLDFDKFKSPTETGLTLGVRPDQPLATVGQPLSVDLREERPGHVLDTDDSRTLITPSVDPPGAGTFDPPGAVELTQGQATVRFTPSQAGKLSLGARGMNGLQAAPVDVLALRLPQPLEASHAVALRTDATLGDASAGPDPRLATARDIRELVLTPGGFVDLYWDAGVVSLTGGVIACDVLQGPSIFSILGPDGRVLGTSQEQPATGGTQLTRLTIGSALVGSSGPLRGIRIRASGSMPSQSLLVDDCAVSSADLLTTRADPWADAHAGVLGSAVQGAPEAALGPPDDDAVSLGPDGVLIVSFEDDLDRPSHGSGQDLLVVERGVPEPYAVDVSADGFSFVHAQDAQGVALIGLPPGGPFRFVRITAKGMTADLDPAPGPDIDAVVALAVRDPAASLATPQADAVVAAVLDASAPPAARFWPNALGAADGAFVQLAPAPDGLLQVVFADNVAQGMGGADAGGDDLAIHELNGASYSVSASADGQTWLPVGSATGTASFALPLPMVRQVRIQATGVLPPAIDAIESLRSLPVP